jgi:hypothetical protein
VNSVRNDGPDLIEPVADDDTGGQTAPTSDPDPTLFPEEPVRTSKAQG